MTEPLNIADYRRLAQRRLPRGVFEFVDRGSEDDVAERGNRRAFEALRLRPRILAGAAPRSLRTRVFDEVCDMPVGIAPVGVAAYMWYRGEMAFAQAAAKMRIPFVLSGATSIPMEAVSACGGPDLKWFQLYVSGDHPRSLQVARRARAAGYSALLLTVDSLVPYKREFAVRSGFDIPFRMRPSGLWDIATHPRWLLGTMARYMTTGGLPRPIDYPLAAPGTPESRGVAFKDDALDWSFLQALREIWPGKLVVKGVLDPRDAEQCVRCGADGIVVSNHGGIALDSALAPIEALPDIVAAAGDDLTILLDGGIRRGSDVVKALALGADLVLVGRAALYALAANGEQGVVHALGLLRDEIGRTLAQVGCRTPMDLTPEYVVGAAPNVRRARPALQESVQ